MLPARQVKMRALHNIYFIITEISDWNVISDFSSSVTELESLQHIAISFNFDLHF